MDEKIEFKVTVLKELMLMTPKCLRSLGVILFLAPPGGPIAAINWVSIKCNSDISFFSYLNDEVLHLN